MIETCCRKRSLRLVQRGQSEGTEGKQLMAFHRPLGYTPVTKSVSSGDVERLNVGQMEYPFKELNSCDMLK